MKFPGKGTRLLLKPADTTHQLEGASPKRPLSHLKTVACIPCFNEEQFIGSVVNGAKAHVDEVIVIDDGSRDGSIQKAKAAGAVVVRHKTNKGYGESIRACLQAARDRGADVLVILDGDGQHNPAQLPSVLSPVLEGKADLVIGSRFLSNGSNTPLYRRFGIWVITQIVNFGSKVKVTDAQSGFRAYSRKVLDAVEPTEKGMGVSVELLIRARARGFSMAEVPISCLYHQQGSTLNPFRHGIGVALIALKHRGKTLMARGQ